MEVEKIIYKAKDGRLFYDPLECEDYEKTIGILPGSVGDLINELEKNDDIITLDNMIGHEYNSDIKKPTSAAWKKQVKRLTRYAVYQYLSDVQNLEQDKGIINNTSDAEDNKKWKKYTSSVKKSNYGLPVRSWFNEHTNPFNGIIDDHYQWTNGVKGKILMSDQENRTAMFSDNLSWEKKYNRKFVEENLSQLREVLKKM